MSKNRIKLSDNSNKILIDILSQLSRTKVTAIGVTKSNNNSISLVLARKKTNSLKIKKLVLSHNKRRSHVEVEDLKKEIIRLKKENLTYDKIAQLLDISKPYISKLIKEKQ